MNISASLRRAVQIAGLLVLTALANASDQVTNWLPGQCHYTGEFTQTRTLQSLPVPLKSSGRFLFDCEAGVIWQTESPVSDTVVYTVGKTNFRVPRNNRAVLLQGVVHSNMAQMLQALMGGDAEYLLQEFSAEIDSTQENNTTGTLTLHPKSASVSRYLQRVTLEKTANAMDIALINSDTESTTIATSSVTGFSAPGLQQCLSLFGNEALACQGLYFPMKLAESLKVNR